jgi:hypothetical protein
VGSPRRSAASPRCRSARACPTVRPP